MKVSRKEDWSWELSNHLCRYNSIPDTETKGCTGPLFPVWRGIVPGPEELSIKPGRSPVWQLCAMSTNGGISLIVWSVT
ncbi:hypothetical protein GUJ93_ZPchr0012g18944 [Zizania palustris]|uniref:Uncharacterized protein n=1 Tax=Zizania palustris TaxID=103762 RepID=A0A8J5WPT9_ZIZPA|nr:hypothetical protein GUJ93_ZPchr0012g18944 [Zizania palustris]